MPRNVEGVRARKTVAQQFPHYIAWLLRQFGTPPEELVKRVEERAGEANANPDRTGEGAPSVPEPKV